LEELDADGVDRVQARVGEVVQVRSVSHERRRVCLPLPLRSAEPFLKLGPHAGLVDVVRVLETHLLAHRAGSDGAHRQAEPLRHDLCKVRLARARRSRECDPHVSLGAADAPSALAASTSSIASENGRSSSQSDVSTWASSRGVCECCATTRASFFAIMGTPIGKPSFTSSPLLNALLPSTSLISCSARSSSRFRYQSAVSRSSLFGSPQSIVTTMPRLNESSSAISTDRHT